MLEMLFLVRLSIEKRIPVKMTISRRDTGCIPSIRENQLVLTADGQNGFKQ